MTDPAPLTPLEVATIKACIGKYTPSHIARLVATVEQTRRERDAADDVVRRLLDGYEADEPCFGPSVLSWFLEGSDESTALTPGEVAAIRRARATEGDRSDG